MTEIIDGMTHEMVGSDSFEQFMNRPLPHNGQAYIQRDYKTGKDYICCPFCGKKNFPLTPGAHITGQKFKCKMCIRDRAMYFAERNKGAYHNLFMTFSGRPKFVEIKGNTITQKKMCIRDRIYRTS